MLQNLQEQRRRQLSAADPAPPWVRSIGLAVGIAYFLAARLSLELLTKPDGVAVFWPASGMAAGVLIARGPGRDCRWRGIMTDAISFSTSVSQPKSAPGAINCGARRSL
jgi:hypothetical protein